MHVILNLQLSNESLQNEIVYGFSAGFKYNRYIERFQNILHWNQIKSQTKI